MNMAKKMIKKHATYYGKACSIQPFLITQTDHYQESRPANSGVSLFYQFCAKDKQSRVIALPDGCIDIVLTFNESEPSVVAYGPMHNSRIMPTSNNTTYFGIRFKPGNIPALLSAEVEDFMDRIVPLSSVSPNSIINRFEQVIEIPTFHERTSYIINTLSEQLDSRKNRYNPTLYSHLISHILFKSGNVKISDLVDQTGYSARYVNKVFQGNLGISPKEFCRQIRLQTALQSMHANQYDNFAELASLLGYYDQSHFICDFKSFTDLTPVDYINHILLALKPDDRQEDF